MLNRYLEQLEENIDKLKFLKEKTKTLYGYTLSLDDIDDLCKTNFELLDSIAFRFSKIQSLLGEKIFRKVLECLGEIVEGKNFLEILNLLEKNYIIKVEEWKELSLIRNSINHEYPEEREEILNKLKSIKC